MAASKFGNRMANLQLVEVRDAGSTNERVFMHALEDLNLCNYVVTDTTYRADGVPSNKLRHVYEFEARSVKKGEYVSLYSKVGTYNLGETTGSPASPIHKIYWGLEETIWNKTGDRAHLFYAPATERQSKVVSPSK